MARARGAVDEELGVFRTLSVVALAPAQDAGRQACDFAQEQRAEPAPETAYRITTPHGSLPTAMSANFVRRAGSITETLSERPLAT